MYLSFSKRVCLIAVFLASATGSHAATDVYTDRAAFDLATGGSLNFEDFSSGSTSNANFSVSGTNVRVLGNGQLRGRPTINGDNMTYVFTSPISAFGGDFDSSPGGNGIGLRFTLGTGEVVSSELLAPFDGFWGFVADSPFSSLTVSGGSGSGFAETHNFDNFSFGLAAPVSPVPLPASLSMLLVALCGAAGLSRWSRKSSVSL